MNTRASYIALGVMIAILLGVDVFLVSRTVSCQKEIAIKDETIWNLSDYQVLNSYLEGTLAFGLKYNRSKFTAATVTDIEGNEINIKKLSERPALVFRFSERDCRECVGFGMMKLSAFAEKAPFPALVMARYDDIHLFQRWGRTIEIPGVKVYYVPSIMETDNISAPYFFILHEDGTVGELFIPDKSVPKQTNVYLETISEKYNQS